MPAWNPFAVALGRFITERRNDLRLKQPAFGQRMGFSATFCSFLEYARMHKLGSGHAEDVSFGHVLAVALELSDERLRRFALCYRIVRQLEDLRVLKDWEACTSRHIKQVLLKEPELCTILWPCVLLMSKREPKDPDVRRRLVTEAHVVQRLRDYILVTLPPISAGTRIPDLPDEIQELKTAA